MAFLSANAPAFETSSSALAPARAWRQVWRRIADAIARREARYQAQQACATLLQQDRFADIGKTREDVQQIAREL